MKARSLTFLLSVCSLLATPLPAAEIPVLAYHDVVVGQPTDDFSVSASAFREQMQYLQRRGYRPISLQTFSDAARGKTVLPGKPIVLTFDDGLKSFQMTVLPILEALGYPAAVSVVTGWTDGRDVPANLQGHVMNWDDLRAVGRSPLVEIIAHSDALHTDVRASLGGITGPSAVTRRYIESTGKVENETAYRARIRHDLESAAGRIRSEIGRSPQGIAWPYGFYNQPIADDANALGMAWQLTISGEPARLENYPHIPRIPVYRVQSLRDFEQIIGQKLFPPKVALAVRLDEIARQDKADRHRWLSDLLERLVILRVDALIVAPPGTNSETVQASWAPAGPDSDFLQQVLYSARVRAGVRYTWLQIPAAEQGMQVHADLARHHIYNGILVPKASKTEATARLLVIYREYHPGLRCGSPGASADSNCKDFVFEEITGDEMADRTFSWHAGNTPIYYLLDEGPSMTGPKLLAAIKALRQKGARHVIVPYGVLAKHPQTLIPVAVELSRLAPGRN